MNSFIGPSSTWLDASLAICTRRHPFYAQAEFAQAEGPAAELFPGQLMVDGSGQIISASPLAISKLGLAADNWLGKRWYAGLPRLEQRHVESMWRAGSQHQAELAFTVDGERGARQLATITFERQQGGGRSRYVGTIVTCPSAADAAALTWAGGADLTGPPAIYWQWHVSTDTFVMSVHDRRSVRFFDATNSLGSAAWWAAVHPRDRPSVIDVLRDSISRDTASFSMRYRFRGEMGQYDTVVDQGCVLRRDHQGRAVEIIGAMHLLPGTASTACRLMSGCHVMEHITESVVATDLNGTVYYWGKGAETLFGWTASEMLGQPITRLVCPEDCDEQMTRLQRALRNGTWSGRHRQRRKDGSTFFAHTYLAVIQDDSGQAIGLVGIDHDVTAQYMEQHMEQRKIAALQSDLANITWLNLKSELLAGVCHEMCQPIYAAQNLAFAASKHLEAGRVAQVATLLTKISQEVTRASELAERLRGYARQSTVRKQPVDLHTILADCRSLGQVHAELSKSAIRFQLCAKASIVECDPIQIRHMFLNLLRNAFEALAYSTLSDRTVVVTTRSDDESIMVSIRDNGPGIPAAVRDKIFDPFFTTKSQGSGIGLPLCNSILELHGGTLKLGETSQGAGSEFVVSLPLCLDDERDTFTAGGDQPRLPVQGADYQ